MLSAAPTISFRLFSSHYTGNLLEFSTKWSRGPEVLSSIPKDTAGKCEPALGFVGSRSWNCRLLIIKAHVQIPVSPFRDCMILVIFLTSLNLTLLICCLSQFRLTKIPLIGWLKQQTFISHSSGGWEVQGWGVSWFGFVVRASFLVCRWLYYHCLHMVERDHLSFFTRFHPHDLITSQMPRLQIRSHWG